MNKPSVVCAALAAVFVTVTALPARAAAGLGPKARIFAKYDANKNGVIDGEEIAAVRAAYAAEPKGEFARYDTNKDGKLSDEEIAQIKPPGGKKGGAEGKKGPHKRTETPGPAGEQKPGSQPSGE